MDARQRLIEEARRAAQAMAEEQGELDSEVFSSPVKEEENDAFNEVGEVISQETLEKIDRATEQSRKAIQSAWSLGKRATERSLVKAKEVTAKVQQVDVRGRVGKLPRPAIRFGRKSIALGMALLLLGGAGMWFLSHQEQPVDVQQVIEAKVEPTDPKPAVSPVAPQEHDTNSSVDEPTPVVVAAKTEADEADVTNLVIEQVAKEAEVEKEPSKAQEADKPKRKKVSEKKSRLKQTEQPKPAPKEKTWQEKANDDIDRFLQQQQ